MTRRCLWLKALLIGRHFNSSVTFVPSALANFPSIVTEALYTPVSSWLM